MKNKKGFTLIEMIGVIVILALLFLLSYTTILNYLKSGQDKVDEGTFNLLKSATKDYLSDHVDEYPEVNKNVFCIEVNTLADNNYVDEDSIISKNNSILTKTMKVSYQDNKYNYELVDQCEEERHLSEKDAIQYLLSKKTNNGSIQNYNAGSKESHKMYTFSHPATDQTEALTDYRYIGNDPYNYVEFNGETWRIIGIFTVEDDIGHKEQRIKLIKQEVGIRLFDDIYHSPWDAYGVSKFLKKDSYNYYYDNGLNEESKEMLKDTKYYLGSEGYVSEHNSGADFYKSERSFSKMDSLISSVGLIYLSDYIYTYANGVNPICYQNSYKCAKWYGEGADPGTGWMYSIFNYKNQWTITLKNSYELWYVVSYGYGRTSKDSVGIGLSDLAPVVYLKPNVKIVSGDGTKDNPYKLKI